ncbi:MAG TPA: DUF4386 domain-containing protein [Acidisarcina sp.]
MPEWISEASPRRLARIAGLVAWITTSAGFAVMVRGRLIVYDDAAATAHNILAHQLQYRLAFTGDIIALLYIAYTLILYKLFKPVNRNISLLAAVMSLMGCGIETFNALFHIAALVVLTSGQSLSAFSVGQLQALALMFLKLNAQGAEIGMVLFGSYNLMVGYLIFRSTFLPRILGGLLAISGACYLFNCFRSLSRLFSKPT